MVRVSERLAGYLLENCSVRTEQGVRDQFGISYQTLRKIEAGEPIRSSVAKRLEDRVLNGADRL